MAMVESVTMPNDRQLDCDDHEGQVAPGQFGLLAGVFLHLSPNDGVRLVPGNGFFRLLKALRDHQLGGGDGDRTNAGDVKLVEFLQQSFNGFPHGLHGDDVAGRNY